MRLLLSFLLLIGNAGAFEMGNIGAGQCAAQMILALVLMDKYLRKTNTKHHT